MSDEIVKEPTEEKPVEQTETITLEKVLAELENVKKAQAGSDKKYQETAKERDRLTAELEKAQLEKMTEKEKAEHELEKRQKQIDAKDREVKEAALRFSIVKALAEKKMDSALADFVSGESEEVVTEKINKLDELIKIEVRKRVDETLSGSKKPVGGEPGGGGTLADKVKGLDMDALNKAIMNGTF